MSISWRNCGMRWDIVKTIEGLGLGLGRGLGGWTACCTNVRTWGEISEPKESQRSECRPVILVFLQYWGGETGDSLETQGTANLAYTTQPDIPFQQSRRWGLTARVVLPPPLTGCGAHAYKCVCMSYTQISLRPGLILTVSCDCLSDTRLSSRDLLRFHGGRTLWAVSAQTPDHCYMTFLHLRGGGSGNDLIPTGLLLYLLGPQPFPLPVSFGGAMARQSFCLEFKT